MKKLLVCILFLFGCGRYGPTMIPPSDVEDFKAELQVYEVEKKNTCLYIQNNLYVFRKGNHLNIYNNEYCYAGQRKKFLLCKKLKAYKYNASNVCWIDNIQASVSKKDNKILLHLIIFN